MAALTTSAFSQSASDDLVAQLPGFKPAPFKVYSGYLQVPGPFQQNGYDSLSIHYQVSLRKEKEEKKKRRKGCCSHQSRAKMIDKGRDTLVWFDTARHSCVGFCACDEDIKACSWEGEGRGGWQRGTHTNTRHCSSHATREGALILLVICTRPCRPDPTCALADNFWGFPAISPPPHHTTHDT